ncbi:MAG: glycosyltransferase, partial [Gammaproteobacteria bacterium]|nr:glycosyltransferase [Gammaproteobacteria bacterium]
TNLRILHVWQEDDGFQKCRILNKAIQAASGDYLIFSDGDCIPRKDFIQTHVEYAEPGYFLSGGYFKLPMATSKAISKQDILSGDAFDVNWLYQHDMSRTYKTLKLTAKGKLASLLNKMTPTKATWNGHNASGWQSDILSVNGFDERMQYGGEDRELGERLFNKGIKSKQIRYCSIVIHLDHSREYKTQDSLDKNRKIRTETRLQRSQWTAHGIVKGSADDILKAS